MKDSRLCRRKFLCKIEVRCSIVVLHKVSRQQKGKGIIAEAKLFCLRVLGWCIAKHVMCCHLCGALSETRDIQKILEFF